MINVIGNTTITIMTMVVATMAMVSMIATKAPEGK